jgi:hypothetical protein
LKTKQINKIARQNAEKYGKIRKQDANKTVVASEPSLSNPGTRKPSLGRHRHNCSIAPTSRKLGSPSIWFRDGFPVAIAERHRLVDAPACKDTPMPGILSIYRPTYQEHLGCFKTGLQRLEKSRYLDSGFCVSSSDRGETDDASLHGRPIGGATAGRLRLCPETWTGEYRRARALIRFGVRVRFLAIDADSGKSRCLDLYPAGGIGNLEKSRTWTR